MPDFDYTKPFQQKNGRRAEFIRRAGWSTHNIFVRYEDEYGEMRTGHFTEDGAFFINTPDDRDLINIPEPQEEAMKLDFNRPFMDDKGHPTRCVLRDFKSSCGCTHIWAASSANDEYLLFTDEHGRSQGGDQIIVNVPETQIRYAHLIKGNGAVITEAPHSAGEFHKELLARKRVEITEGEFDE